MLVQNVIAANISSQNREHQRKRTVAVPNDRTVLL